LFYAFQTVREVDWGKLATLETRKWTYSTRAMKTDLDGAQTSRTLVEQFETFLTKEVKQRLGLTQEEPTSAAAGKPTKLPAKRDESAGKEKERAAK
jgi:hypothetical protein